MLVLIPAYQPDGRLADLVRALGRHPVLVVDDGSGPAYAEFFDRARRAGAEVVTLDRNRGKGFALRAGFAHAAAHHPGHDVVCADSDGQHRPADIEAVAARVGAGGAAMVLGVRRFTGTVPVRSRFGNSATRVLFRLVTGIAVTDTQTGLRGYPARMLGWLGRVPGDRFEYELRLLLRAARERLTVEQVEIATVYLDGNRSSHFRPLRDSARVYGPLLGFAASSLLAFAVDAALLAILVSVTGQLVLSAVTARLVSATLNYSINRTAVFDRVPHRRAAPRYAALAALSLTANVLLLGRLTDLLGSLVLAKPLTEATLFAAGFLAQRAFVFSRGREARGGQTVPVGDAAFSRGREARGGQTVPVGDAAFSTPRPISGTPGSAPPSERSRWRPAVAGGPEVATTAQPPADPPAAGPAGGPSRSGTAAVSSGVTWAGNG
ncbi:polysaccharide synthesis protein GtrA [Actinoplanes ianthinogenes]|uniref:Polysaccharide synthesis protein GtrA n=1 Tax=Actinoplanes ianthinogenes TaxID=122358 RepID=A0ABM7LM25_9ACTN|nr:GtrA family protein [Actinoplanes ianthinogenes]BCJ40300.1 polysaccharide synthesis protein GtrA [Actinoplanes ianthinogenes]GGR11427.1 polysaccharide synthesis protein GtrA [Actinoplanes ianthinogenes]